MLNKDVVIMLTGEYVFFQQLFIYRAEFSLSNVTVCLIIIIIIVVIIIIIKIIIIKNK